MDEETLRKSLIEERTGDAEEAQQSEEERKFALMHEAWLIRKKFPMATPEERKEMEARYQEIDAELTPILQRLEERKKRGRSAGVEQRAAETHEFERGRREIREKARAGANEATFNRIKSELNYLLNNYKPSLEPQIEMLIDKWRRSGDPNYDPEIRVRLRNARKKKAFNEHPL